MVIVRANDWAIEDVNPRLCELTGYSRDELIGTRPPYPFWSPASAAEIERQLAVTFAGTSGDYEAQFRHRSGEEIWVLLARAPLFDRARRVVASITTVNDITERKRSEADLREREQQYRAITETASDAIITIDEESRILFANPATERVFGYPISELTGRPLSVLMPEEMRARHRAGVRRYLTTGRRGVSWQALELPGLHRDGHEVPLEVSFGEVVRHGRRVFTGVLRDMTERREAEAAVRRSEEHLQRAQRMEAVGRLAGAVAHDFNNLLTAIIGHADLLLADTPPESPVRADLEEIRRTADRAANLTRQLLAFSRRQVFDPQVVDVNAVVEQLEPMLRRLLVERVELLSLLDSSPQLVRADRSQLEQVVVNLVVNARDAMPDGGVVTIETGGDSVVEAGDGSGPVDAGAYVALTVRDTGHGMDAEVQRHLFEPFFTTKPAGKGTGLGLATVYGIVRQSGGEISVITEVGHGTAFRILLPRAPEDAATAPEPVRATPGRLHGSETILVAEDEPAVRSLARVILARHGYDVLEAARPSQALLIAERHPGPIDLLLTDVVMPEMSGPQLASRLHRIRPNVPVLFMSGYPEESTDGTVLDAGANYLQKPFDPQSLLLKVRAVLDAGTHSDARANPG